MKNIRSPSEIFHYYSGMLLNRIIKMFDWTGMPDTIDVDFLNYTLITYGSVGFTDFSGKLYALFGNVGGEPNEYYFPRLYVIANPVLGSKTIKIDENGVVMYNSTIDRFTQPTNYGNPLNSLIDITAQRLTETTISALTASKNIRAALLISAKDDETRQAAEVALRKIYNGEPDVIFRDKVIDSLNITVNPVIGDAARALTELREEYQFTLAQFYNAIGIQANYNLKRERLNTSEVNSNLDALLINIADMLYQRQIAVEKINAMFGTSISVDFSEEWKQTEALQNDRFDVETQDENTDESEGEENADS